MCIRDSVMDNEIQEFNSARRATVQTYKFTILKVRKIVAHITFNKTCLNKSITQKYAQIKIKHNYKIKHQLK